MKKEIGGYFSLEKTSEHNDELYQNLLALNSGRNAFLFYVQTMEIKKVFLPFYLCDSIYKVCLANAIEFEQYHIDRNFKPIFDKPLKNGELLYIVNYYGQLNDKDIKKLKEKYSNIIVDNVQCFYSSPIEGIPTIYSCRKFLGVPDGAYLSSKGFKIDDLPQDDSSKRFKHLIGRMNDGAQAHYKEYLKNEELFNELPIKRMSPESKRILCEVDYQKHIKIRKENFQFLDTQLRYFNLLKLKINNGPYCYPLYIKNAALLRDELIKNKIYIPILWPNVLNEGNSLEKDFANNILPLPCDQRYDLEDMKVICDIVKNYVKE